MSATAERPTATAANPRSLIWAGIILGASQAGFFDGIVIHQLLQWHHMFSSIEPDSTVAGLELNTLGDGLFHLFDWGLTLAGLALLWRTAKHHPTALSTSVFVGALLLGAGLFNVIEGVIDHHLLGIHHVKAGPYQSVYDWGFLAISGTLAVVGGLLVRQGSRRA